MSAALAVIGHNNPPEPTPFEIARNSVEAVFEEAKHWLDGAAVTTQDEATAIAMLLDTARKAGALATEQKGVEKRPHLDANAEIEARFKALTTRLDVITKGCKAALTPWEVAQEAQRRAEAEAARREAEAKAEAAQAALRAASLADVEARDRAEALVRDAKKADAAANKAERATSATKAGARALSLRTTYRAEITDPHAFLVAAWKERHPDLIEFLAELAQRQVNAGRRGIPGVTVHEDRSAA